MQLTAGADCRHPPKSLVDTAAADPRRELQRRCGCVLSSAPDALHGCCTAGTHAHATCVQPSRLVAKCLHMRAPCAVGHLQLPCLTCFGVTAQQVWCSAVLPLPKDP